MDDVERVRSLFHDTDARARALTRAYAARGRSRSPVQRVQANGTKLDCDYTCVSAYARTDSRLHVRYTWITRERASPHLVTIEATENNYFLRNSNQRPHSRNFQLVVRSFERATDFCQFSREQGLFIAHAAMNISTIFRRRVVTDAPRERVESRIKRVVGACSLWRFILQERKTSLLILSTRNQSKQDRCSDSLTDSESDAQCSVSSIDFPSLIRRHRAIHRRISWPRAFVDALDDRSFLGDLSAAN